MSFINEYVIRQNSAPNSLGFPIILLTQHARKLYQPEWKCYAPSDNKMFLWKRAMDVAMCLGSTFASLSVDVFKNRYGRDAEMLQEDEMPETAWWEAEF